MRRVAHLLPFLSLAACGPSGLASFASYELVVLVNQPPVRPGAVADRAAVQLRHVGDAAQNACAQLPETVEATIGGVAMQLHSRGGPAGEAGKCVDAWFFVATGTTLPDDAVTQVVIRAGSEEIRAGFKDLTADRSLSFTPANPNEGDVVQVTLSPSTDVHYQSPGDLPSPPSFALTEVSAAELPSSASLEIASGAIPTFGVTLPSGAGAEQFRGKSVQFRFDGVLDPGETECVGVVACNADLVFQTIVSPTFTIGQP